MEVSTPPPPGGAQAYDILLNLVFAILLAQGILVRSPYLTTQQFQQGLRPLPPNNIPRRLLSLTTARRKVDSGVI